MKAKTVEELRLEKGRYKLVSKAKGRATFQPTLFPGLRIPLAGIWS